MFWGISDSNCLSTVLCQMQNVRFIRGIKETLCPGWVICLWEVKQNSLEYFQAVSKQHNYFLLQISIIAYIIGQLVVFVS